MVLGSSGKLLSGGLRPINLGTPGWFSVCVSWGERVVNFCGDADICFIPIKLPEWVCWRFVGRGVSWVENNAKWNQDSHQRGSGESPDPALLWSFHAYENSLDSRTEFIR